MSLWDHLCTILRARIVSVEDVSNKVDDSPYPHQSSDGCRNACYLLLWGHRILSCASLHVAG